MNTAAKGRRNEYRSMALFGALGYETMRSAASKGVWDFVAWSPTETVLVQVKSTRWPSPVEVEGMQASPLPPGGRKLIHRWKPHQRLPDVKEI